MMHEAKSVFGLVIGVMFICALVSCRPTNAEQGAECVCPEPEPIRCPEPEIVYVKEGESPKPQGERIRVTARALYKEMAENLIAARAKYDGNVVEVTGKIGSIMVNEFNQPMTVFQFSAWEFLAVHNIEGAETLKSGRTTTFVCSQLDQNANGVMIVSNCWVE